MLHYLREPRDKLCLATPSRFPAGSPCLKSMLLKIWQSHIQTQVKPDTYNGFMDIFRESITAWGLEKARLDPCVFSPVSLYAAQASLLPSADAARRCQAIVGKVACVNVFWLSCRGGGGGGEVQPQEGSLGAALLAYAERQGATRHARKRLRGKTDLLEPLTEAPRRAAPDIEHPLAWPDNLGIGAPSFQKTDLFRNYQLEKRLGSGTHGQVFLATA